VIAADVSRARLWFAATALLVLVGVAIQIPVSANAKHGFFNGTAAAFNVFAFFTIQSNLIVGATCLLLAWKLDRASMVFKVFRLIGIVAITVTGVVYHVALAGLFDLDSWALAADMILHTVVPVVAVLGWLLYGPRGLTSRQVAKLTLLFPAFYMVFTMIRGAVVGFYPYPFADVNALGYPRVIVNGVWISLIFFGLAVGADALDKFLTRRATQSEAGPAPR
jgi:hypothetical protein